jgi:putative tricarboxylic transport membrane protein
MLAGFQQYGLNPGPLLFAERPDLVWGLIASLFIANAMLLVLNLPLVGLWVRLLAIPQPWLYAGILVFATMGTIAAKPSVVELTMLTVFGVLGFLMRRYDYPIAPVDTARIAIAQARLLYDALRQLGVESAVVVGHSWGTLVAVALGLNHQQMVKWLILLSGFYFPRFRLDHAPYIAPMDLFVVPIV